MQEIMKRLRAPFAPEEIEWRVGATTKDKAKGMALAFVTNRAIQNRLDEVFGCFVIVNVPIFKPSIVTAFAFPPAYTSTVCGVMLVANTVIFTVTVFV